jgi:hypothetical protein
LVYTKGLQCYITGFEMVTEELPLIVVLREVDAEVDTLSLESAVIHAKRKTSRRDWNCGSIKEHDQYIPNITTLNIERERNTVMHGTMKKPN